MGLLTDHMENPLGIEAENPGLSWRVMTAGDFNQTAYQVLAASRPEWLSEKTADLWNSGIVTSGESLHVPYAGLPLKSGQRCYWKVRIWDQNGQPSEYSAPAWWEMGLLKAEDWEARWISSVPESDSVPPVLPSPWFRKEFDSDAGSASARLYISGLGYYVAYINGRRIGDHVLDPAMTRYDRRVKYVAYDVGEYLLPGANTLGVVLGNGWYNQHTRTAWDFDRAPWRESPALRCQLVITNREGSIHTVVSDESWKFSTGPIVFNGIHNGESYDARIDLGNWHSAGYDDAGWHPALAVPGPSGKMSAQLMPPIREIGTLEPVKTWTLGDSLFMADFGRNITGYAHIRVKGPAGAEVRLRYGERIAEDGSLDIRELSRFIWTGDTQTDRYILKGGNMEEWHPLFVYHGFQYIEFFLSDPAVELNGLEARIVHTDLRRRGYFRCSNDLFNTLHDNIGHSFLGNYHGYPTDCPHREKMGWTGDALLVAETGLFNFDLTRAYLKWIDDFVDEQRENGQLPGIVPTSGWGYTYGRGENRERGYGPQWEGAFMEIPLQLYRFTGDSSVIGRYYDEFKKYVEYLRAHSSGHLLDFGIDDHKQLRPLTQGHFLSSAFYYHLTRMLSEMAGITGRMSDATRYKVLAGEIKVAFNRRYFNPEAGIYDHGGQTPMALALYFDLVEDPDQQVVVQNLLAAIRDKEGHIDAGVVGTKAVINALLMYDQDHVLYEMADKRTFPGWGYWVEEFGAKTMFQNWDGSQSRNHIMFGSIGDYFYKGLGGINIDDRRPGFRHIVVRPSLDNDITWVEAGLETLYGPVSVHWMKDGEVLRLDVHHPPGTTIDIELPENLAVALRVNGKNHRTDQ